MSNPKQICAPVFGFALFVLSIVPAVVQAEPPEAAGIITIKERNIKEKVAAALIQQEPTTSMINMKNATNRNAARPRRTFPHWHLGFYAAEVGGVSVLGAGLGSEVGVSYVTPTYAVGFQVRGARGLVLDDELFPLPLPALIGTASIGGSISSNTYISPYLGIGGGLSIIAPSPIGPTPSAYGVVGIAMPHFSKHRFKLEMRVDRIIPEWTSVTLPEWTSVSLGVFFSTTIF